MSTNDGIGWFEDLSKRIDEQGVVAMMVMSQSRRVAGLLASTARDPQQAEGELLPVVANVLATLVAGQVDCEAVKLEYRDAEQIRQQKAALDEATASWRREQQHANEAREQQRRSWGQR